MRRIAFGPMYSRFFTLLGFLLCCLLVVFSMAAMQGCATTGAGGEQVGYNAETDLPMATYVFAYYVKPEVIEPMQQFCTEMTLVPDADIFVEVLQRYLDKYSAEIFEDPVLADWLIMRLQQSGIPVSPDLIVDNTVTKLPLEDLLAAKQKVSYICKGIQMAYDRRANEGK